jgi:hypothetical protein
MFYLVSHVSLGNFAKYNRLGNLERNRDRAVLGPQEALVWIAGEVVRIYRTFDVAGATAPVCPLWCDFCKCPCYAGLFVVGQ